MKVEQTEVLIVGAGPSGAVATGLLRKLSCAGLSASAINYINLHGAATPRNDAMAAKAVAAVLGESTPVSSTKPLPGHTLGAASSIKGATAWAALADNPDGQLPANYWGGAFDPPKRSGIEPGSRRGRPLQHVPSSSCAFAGSNASLILGAD